MKIEQILTSPGINILDNNVFQEDSTFSRYLYNCESPRDFITKRHTSTLKSLVKSVDFFTFPKVFSIQEVAQEIEITMEKLNELILYHSKETRGNLKFHRAPKEKISRKPNWEKHSRRRHNRGVKKNQKKLLYTTPSKENYRNLEILKVINDIWFKLSKIIQKQNIAQIFSDEEKEMYNNFTNYFEFICKEYGLKKDFSARYNILKNRNPCDFGTDEKLTAAALTLTYTRKEPIKLISSDSDIQRMMSHFWFDKLDTNRFDLPATKKRPQLYATYGPIPNFQLQNIAAKYNKT